MTEISKIISFKTRKIYILGVLVCLSVEQTSRQSLSYGTIPVRNSTGNSSVCKFHDQLFFAPNNNGFLSKMSTNKCIFSAKWLSQESYKPWLKEFKGDNRNAFVPYVTNLLTLALWVTVP